MSKLTPILATAALASLVSCFYPEPVPPPHRPYGPDYDISPPPPPSQPQPSAFSDPGVPQPPTTTAPAPAPPPPTANGNFPTATRTEKPDQVLSPYEPYNVIDVGGFKSGQLARDPSNQKIFRVP